MHTFAAVGTYTVVLTATNSLGSDVYSDTVEIISLQPPSASFQSSSPDLLGETTVFTNTSSGSDLSFAWDFGDGSPVLTTTNPVHTFGAAGVYTVTLTAANALGSDVYSDTVEITTPPILVFLPLVER
jgi:PKD repeat protein